MKYNRPIDGQTINYIRTKDGQIIYIGYLTFYKSDEPYAGEGIGIWEGRVPIIKAADTIEELCDELVVVVGKGDGSHNFVADSKRIATWNASLGAKVYGAIWTDKGLIYVAKMNKKGELELL